MTSCLQIPSKRESFLKGTNSEISLLSNINRSGPSCSKLTMSLVSEFFF